jgi:hypothetical protein
VGTAAFWETLERVAALAGGKPPARPTLVDLDGEPAEALGRGVPGGLPETSDGGAGIDSAARGASPSPAGEAPVLPVSQAEAVFETLGTLSGPMREFGKRTKAAQADAPTVGPETASLARSWDEVDTSPSDAPSTFLAGLAAKHRVFAETGEIDMDLDRIGRKRRRGRRRGH